MGIALGLSTRTRRGESYGRDFKDGLDSAMELVAGCVDTGFGLVVKYLPR
jgi:hypothetical protein